MFKVASLNGNGANQTLLSMNNLVEGNIHGGIIDNTTGTKQNVTFIVGTVEFPLSVDANGTTPVSKINVPSDTTVQVNAPIGVNVSISYIETAADASAALTTIQGLVSEADTSATNAGISETNANNSAINANLSAENANESETNASNSEIMANKWAVNPEDTEVLTGQFSAYHWARKAQAVASGDVIDDTVINNLLTWSSTKINSLDVANVKLSGDQTIDGTKTFTSSPIVPVPTTDFQSVPLRSTNITVNVGAGQTYTTINQALEYLSAFYPMYKKSGVTATINLKAGFVMAEQVLVSGIDLGWITIVGEDAETIITHTALTTSFNGDYPVFGVDKGGTSPIIGQLFRFNVEKVGGSKHGLMTYGAGSSANILTGKGFIGAGTNGILADAASTINASSANCSNAGTNGIYAHASSTINAINANCSNAGTNGILADAASTINASSANCSNAGNIGIYAHASSTINAINANCSNAGTIGIYAVYSSTINAANAVIQNQTTGTARIKVQDGSTVEATGINTTGGTVPVFSQAVNTLTAHGIIYQ